MQPWSLFLEEVVLVLSFGIGKRRLGVVIILCFWGNDVVALEGQAVFHALLTARRMSFESLVVETDRVVLFKALGEAVSDSPWTTC